MQANPFAHRAPLLPTVLPHPLTRTLPLAALSALALALTLTSLPALAVYRRHSQQALTVPALHRYRVPSAGRARYPVFAPVAVHRERCASVSVNHGDVG